jgi:succinate-semialdehyde dehydrogenase/glutarate-semialdehyde dehydrogenase
MGKVIGAARDEVAKCASGCRFYAEHAEAFLAPEQVDGPDQQVVVQPLGAVLAIMPWNFPFWQTVRFAAPALAAGNVGVLKHASNVPQCALALEDVFRRAGAPPGVFQTLLIGSDLVERVIADDRIAAVTLTGSEAAGRSVAAAAGKHLKKTVLELGGSDPFIVLASADVERAVATAVQARIVNNGQSCIAAKRFIVVDTVYDGFARELAGRMRALRLGDPMDEQTELGPLATEAIRSELSRQVAESVAAGARVLVGGEAREGQGLFFPPTVLVDVPARAPAAREELFGPVAALFRVADADEALARANDTTFGLGASVWTRDRTEAARFSAELAAGSIFVNDMVASDPRFPFGGIKRSGYGRELGVHGLREFVNVKTVRMNFR